jgi:glycosyltransferase involved in cell wall biosynthesis
MNFDPIITVLLPVRNEIRYIKRCLDSIVNQTISKDIIEVLVIDGNSSDGTKEIIKYYSDKYNYIKLIENPFCDTISSLNLGIKNARGNIIVRVDGHTVLEEDYIETATKILNKTGADNVGGLMRPIGNKYIQKSIALAMSSIFGIGWGKFHYSLKEGFVDTVYLGVFKREIFEKLGYFDPDMPFNEDNEYNLRITISGGKIYLSPKIKSYYFPRDNLKDLAKQFFRYGFYKPKILKKYKRIFSSRHIVPLIFILGILFLIILSICNFKKSIFLAIYLCVYFIIAFIFSLYISFKNNIKYLFSLPIVFFVIHFNYGLGLLLGLIKFIIFDGSKKNNKSMARQTF